MDNSYPIDELIASFNAMFEGIQLSYKDVSLGHAKAHCFFTYISDESTLKDNWIKISNYIALKFQNTLENEFERWNIYLFIVSDNEISDELKYQIENDTFSNRKIIITPKQPFDEIIKEHILNNDLNVQAAIVTDLGLDPNPIVWGALKDITSAKRVTQDIRDSLDQIIENIKSNHHEI